MTDFSGIINVFKPVGMSSFKCLSIVKRRLWEQMPVDTRPKFKNWRVGHLGTLDPLACGVLVLLCGPGMYIIINTIFMLVLLCRPDMYIIINTICMLVLLCWPGMYIIINI